MKREAAILSYLYCLSQDTSLQGQSASARRRLPAAIFHCFFLLRIAPSLDSPIASLSEFIEALQSVRGTGNFERVVAVLLFSWTNHFAIKRLRK